MRGPVDTRIMVHSKNVHKVMEPTARIRAELVQA